jgi:adenylate kinase
MIKKAEIPKIIIILGPPGSGKGTQTQLLSEKFGFFQFETSTIVGRVIEQAAPGDFIEIEGKKYNFKAQDEVRNSGKLWDSAFVFHFVNKKVEELASEKEGIVISGSPRNIEEGKRLIPLLEKLYGRKNIIIFALQLDPKDTLWRNSHRRECKLATHSILYTKETDELTKCPLDGSVLMHRRDDNPTAIKTRLEEYKSKTFPLLEYLRTEKLRVKEINGGHSVAKVFENILSALNDQD